MKSEHRPVDDLTVLPDNPRQGDIGAISESLRRFGQQKPIVVNSEGVILAGNHTYLAAVALGWEEIWVHETDLEGTDQPGFALADNRLSDLANYDNAVLLELLLEQEDLSGLGFDASDVETLGRLVATFGDDAALDPYAHWSGMPAFNGEPRQSAYKTTVHFPTQEDADRFFALLGVGKRAIIWWPNSDGHKGEIINELAWVEEE